MTNILNYNYAKDMEVGTKEFNQLVAIHFVLRAKFTEKIEYFKKIYNRVVEYAKRYFEENEDECEYKIEGTDFIIKKIEKNLLVFDKKSYFSDLLDKKGEIKDTYNMKQNIDQYIINKYSGGVSRAHQGVLSISEAMIIGYKYKEEYEPYMKIMNNIIVKIKDILINSKTFSYELKNHGTFLIKSIKSHSCRIITSEVPIEIRDNYMKTIEVIRFSLWKRNEDEDEETQEYEEEFQFC